MDYLWGRYSALIYSGITTIILLPLTIISPVLIPFFSITAILTIIGIFDFFQKTSLVRANFPILGHMRYFFESFRPELRQYFWEDDKDQLPYSRNQRSMVYQRAKSITAIRPFGSIENMYEEDFTWLNHSLAPIHSNSEDFHTVVGEGSKAYKMSLINISGTSFGSVSPRAIQALNTGAALGNFAHNTGEGSISKYHEAGAGDLVWQISTGYFGCRTSDGGLDRILFKKKACLDQVKMIEIKLSQGAKPGHGGCYLVTK